MDGAAYNLHYSIMEAHMDWRERIEGVLLGTAVGDALGLPREGLHPTRAKKLYGGAPLHYRFFMGRGMVSDDTEHTCMLGQSLLASPDSLDGFIRSFAWRLRWWFVGLPVSVGWGTLRALSRLWVGYSPQKSGVFSAGNGPAMRAALLGVCLHDLDTLKEYNRASTMITHTDPKAEQGALAIALAAYFASHTTQKPLEILSSITEHLTDPALLSLLEKVRDHLVNESDPEHFAHLLGFSNGASGYMYDTVPAALFCWLRYPADFRRAVESAILLGGDTDTIGAIVGALSGATLGSSQIPASLIDELHEWPRSVHWMRRLSTSLAEQFPLAGKAQRRAPISLFWPLILLRNLFFLCGVLRYGFRRLLPPY
jgi:ADP-ribosyl-[dinitrogen reductase] hydrolase